MYTMMQACKETNMSYQALKYYCNEGLVPNVKRTATTAASLTSTMSNGLKIWFV